MRTESTNTLASVIPLRETASTRPPKAPSAIRIETRLGGVAVVTMDDPHEAHNTIGPELGTELTAALARLDADASVRAIVLRGKKDSFLAGANLDFVRSLRFASDAAEGSREVSRRFGAMARGPKPIVACVHGPALGGGFELALACTAAIASDDTKTLLGLPEVKLGLMPAANGLLRVAERAGLRVAIDLGLTGRSLRPARAHALGLVDDVVPASILLEASAELALRLTDPREHASLLRDRRRRSQRGIERAKRALIEGNIVGRTLLFQRARAEAAAKTRGHYPAPGRILDELWRWSWRGFTSAAELEAKLFGELVVSETARRLIDLFFAEAALRKETGLEPNEKAHPFAVERVAVIGAGAVGAEVASSCIEAGLAVRMKDRDASAIGRALKRVREHLDARVTRGALTSYEREALFARLTGTRDDAGLGTADLVVEAVSEDLAQKHTVIREIEARVKDTCVIASTTSSIPIATIAEAARRPELVVGMHYPVGFTGSAAGAEKSALLEVVRTQASSPRAIATAVAVGKRQRKTVIVVRDAPGFYTTRILRRYLAEAAHLVVDGAPEDIVDDALVDWGFPIGPRTLQERLGRGFATSVTTNVTRNVMSRRATASLGGGAFRVEEAQARCSLALVNEALRCLEEGVLRSARDGDLGAILGVGFPPFRGGPFRYVDSVGASEVLRRMRSLEQQVGARFEPSPRLVEMARKGRRFYD